MRAFLLCGAAAMTLVGSAPLPYAVPAAYAETVAPPVTPVRCSQVADTDAYANQTISVTGTRARQNTKKNARSKKSEMAYAPPPPPPPVMAPTPAMPAPMVAPPAQMASPSVGYLSAGMPVQEDRERYDGKAVSSVMRVAESPVSTFSVDVDTGAYANVRRMLNDGRTPPPEAVRTEELLNYFRYDYPLPTDRLKPFSITTDMAQTPWNPNSRILRVGLRAYDVPRNERPPANLVFLVDVSGSMSSPDKLPLVKSALSLLADQLRPNDTVSIVVYAGQAGIVLEPTHDGAYVKQALECLTSGGSTAGGAGIALAYSTARAHMIKGGINRVILCTDGDFNVGVTQGTELEALVKQNREDGITLTTLGFGTGNYNEAMMERIADVGNGNYAYVDSAMEARKVLDDELSATLFTVAKDVKIQVEFNPKYVSQYRLIGYENRALAEQDFDNDAVDAGDMGAGHQVTALYEIIPADTQGWLPDRHFAANQPVGTEGHGNDLVWLKLRYKLPDGGASRLIEQGLPASMLKDARPATGDLAFAASVAAYGQILRGDTYLNGYNLAEARILAGQQSDYRRQEFLELTRLAEQSKAPG